MNIELIWSEYKSALRAFLHTKLSDEDDVDDLLQEILIKSYTHIGDLKNESSIKSWLFQIAQRTAIDFYRSRGRHQELVSDDLWYQQDEEGVKSELAICVQPFIQSLAEEDAKLLTAIDLEGESQKALAESLGISYSTLKSRVQKARLQLRQVFDRCCRYELDSQGNLMDYSPKQGNCKNC